MSKLRNGVHSLVILSAVVAAGYDISQLGTDSDAGTLSTIIQHVDQNTDSRHLPLYSIENQASMNDLNPGLVTPRKYSASASSSTASRAELSAQTPAALLSLPTHTITATAVPNENEGRIDWRQKISRLKSLQDATIH